MFGKAVVVGELGQTIDARQYIPSVNLPQNIQKPTHTAEAVSKNFVVHSLLLTPGKVARQALSKDVMRTPVYLVGTDDLSIKWLKHYLPTLKAIGARGYLVNVNGEQAYNTFVNQVGVKLLPISGDGFAKTYHLTHYPVLIGKQLIEQ